MPAGKGRFIVGAKGTHGCEGFPVVGGEGKVHGCHPTLAAAREQQAAIYAAQNREAKKSAEATWTGFFYPETTKATELSNTPTPQVDMEDPSAQKEYKGCGCATCKEMNVDCPNCPVCKEESMGQPEEKRDYSSQSRERMATEGTAMPDGSFPIANATDLHNAIQSVGRAKDYNAAKQHIMRRARALGLVDQLPEDWKKGVRKTEWGGSIFDLNPFVK